ncbi:MAG: MarR family winged helix-turn-helix transcriptional regulator [Sedimentibacter sp.]
MDLNENNIENILFDFIDQIKMLLAPETWQNILLNLSKNEMLVMILLYRETNVNMTRIAEYLNVPLNTATGIVARMEKKGIALRVRSVEDKRIVNIVLSDMGKEQLQNIMQMLINYGTQIISSLSADEIALFGKVFDKAIAAIQDVQKTEDKQANKVRKITIE